MAGQLHGPNLPGQGFIEQGSKQRLAVQGVSKVKKWVRGRVVCPADARGESRACRPLSCCWVGLPFPVDRCVLRENFRKNRLNLSSQSCTPICWLTGGHGRTVPTVLYGGTYLEAVVSLDGGGP